MKCPYCGKEMDLGYIQCRDGVFWTPKKQLVAALSGLGKGAVALNNGASDWNDGTSERTSVVYAHRCAGCEKVIIDCAPKSE